MKIRVTINTDGWDCEMTKAEIFGTEICECGLPKKECDVDA